MYLADYHTHSAVSHDGRMRISEMAERYIAAGFDEFCVTDHMDTTDPRSPELNPSFPWAELERQYREAVEAFGDRIRIRMGVEIGGAPWASEHTERLMSGAPELDFTIGSMHMLSHRYGCIDLSFFDPADETAARAGIRDNLEQILALAKWGKFSVLGHLTLSLRYLNERRGFNLTIDGFEAEVEEIFRALIQKGCGIELNTNRGSFPLPSAKWLKLYRSLGGEIITLGSDVHGPAHIGCGIRENQVLLKECGFKRFCTFEKMTPIWHDL